MFSRRRKSSAISYDLDVLQHNLTGFTASSQALDTADTDVGLLGLNLLYAPPVPFLELIFVHGLRGGSRKTWSKTNNPFHYWPKEWLPRDPEFENVRIFSFGYDSNWGIRKESTLNLHDFGKSLLYEVLNSPEIERDGDTPIIFVGHSMGGLIIKKAYILANQDQGCKKLVERIHGLVFLATPHRGADSATLLKNVLKAVAHGPKAFVSDLERHSEALQSINDGFRHYANALELRSFYETVKTNLGVSSQLIVNIDSAVLGYHNEESALLNANHRNICKFDSPSDSNFITFRNSLASMTKNATRKVGATRLIEYRSQLQELQQYLGISEVPEDDLVALEEGKVEGSCNWLTVKEQFQIWRDSQPSTRPYYWITAQPGAGKSVIAAHTVRHLDSINASCSFYFFKHNNAAKSSTSMCLRSIAYQMALLDFRVWRRLQDLKHNNVQFDRDNELLIWRKVFLNGILDLALENTHIWVIDALDECVTTNSIAAMLTKIPSTFPLKVFLTSRRTFGSAEWLPLLKNLSYEDQITPEDSRHDITLYLNTRMESLPLQDEKLRESVKANIIEKSHGSFLWVTLVLNEMRFIARESDIQRILNEIPPGLDALYERALKTMSGITRGKELIVSILQWVVCAFRPLTLKEMEHALKLYTGENVLSLEKFLSISCEQLIHVDKGGRIEVVHETVRSLLLRTDLDSEFAVDKSRAHGSIAEVCLRYLNGEEMKPPRTPKLMQMYKVKASKRSAFADYASPYFSQHLRRSTSENNERFLSLCKFMNGNVYSWIEHLASNSHLHHMTRTAKDLRGFLNARAKYYSPVNKDVHCVSNWEQDLIRLASQFGKHLTEYPSSIFWLIPPFCPPLSQIAIQFKPSISTIRVEGLQAGKWSDRISSIHYRREIQTRAVCCSTTSFAIGLSDKKVNIHLHATCQQVQQLITPQPVKNMVFSKSGDLLAVSTIHFIILFDLDTSNQTWKVRLPQESLTMAFTDDDKVLRLVTKGGVLTALLVINGSQISSSLLEHPPDNENGDFRRALTHSAVSPEIEMIFSVQRGRPISLHEIETGSFLGVCERDCDTGMEGTDHAPVWIRDMICVTNPVKTYLAALYHDGDLALFDPCELSLSGHVLAEAHVLGASPDGYVLATGNDSGTIQIYDLETLTLLHKIISSDRSIRSLAFSVDGTRFIDIRGNQCNIWELPVLIHNDVGDSGSMSNVIIPEGSVVGVNTAPEPEITALACHNNGKYIFCGRDDGAVVLYSTSNGKALRPLYNHANMVGIKNLVWGDETQTLVSSDAASRIMLWKIIEQEDTIRTEGPILDDRIDDQSIKQVLLSHHETKLLISTDASDITYEIEPGTQTVASFSDRPSSWKWVNHPHNPSKLLYITARTIHIYSWNSDLLEPQPEEELALPLELDTNLSIKEATILHSNNPKLSIELSGSSDPHSPSQILILSISSFNPPYPSILPQQTPNFSNLSSEIEYLIGSVNNRLIFLDKRMWICSLDLENFRGDYYRHCFLPSDWLNANWNFIMKVTSIGDLIFVRRTELAVINGGLESREVLGRVKD